MDYVQEMLSEIRLNKVGTRPSSKQGWQKRGEETRPTSQLAYMAGVLPRHQGSRRTIETICVRNTGRGGIVYQNRFQMGVNPGRFNMVVSKTIVYHGAETPLFSTS